MFVFFVTFILYLCTLFPSVAPYRDTGEMVSVAHTLGVAHPPGYPFYTLLSKLFLSIVPLANAGYRLNVLSALAGAATAGLLYRLLRKLSLPALPAAFLSLFFAVSYLQWYLSLVSEMYTLNTLFAVLVIYCLVCFYEAGETTDGRQTYLYSAVFLFGAGLGIRMDLLLIGPALAVIMLSRRKQFTLRTLALAGFLFVAGFSVFAYLPVRSASGPLLDWNHPATLSRLWGTLTRKTHGGTLDLISESYAPGENFGATIIFYFRHLLTGFAYAGLPLGLLGLYSLWRRKRAIAFSTFLAWVLAGPVFIYLSNMPPNTHALAILEAHFLLPNLLFMVWVGEGVYYIFGRSTPAWRYAGTGCAALLFCGNLGLHFPELDKRVNFVAYDYSKNVLRSVPPASVLVMKKDVQLFSLWNKQLVEHCRPDVAIISQGLAGSPWYIDKFNLLHKGVVIGSLRNGGDWKNLVENNADRQVYFTGDSDYTRPDGYDEEPDGLVNRVTKTIASDGEVLLTAIYPYRGKFLYSAYREFFTPDLIEDYAHAYFSLGQYYVQAASYDRGRKLLSMAVGLRELMPVACNTIAYSYSAEGKWQQARSEYLVTVGQYEALQALAKQFNTLPEAQEGIARDLSDVYVSLGVCAEKLNDDEEALRYYATAIDVFPAKPRAYFNRSVIYWKRNDWTSVIRELESALRIDPGFKEAAYYLSLARQKMK
jgi:tetratricopeptide (TPR) repeat protein